MLGWVYLRRDTDELRAFVLLDSSSHELPHSYTVLHSLGLAFHSWQRDCCGSREVGQEVVVAAVGMFSVTQLQSLVLKTMVPLHHWHLSPCILHLQVFPQHWSVSLCLLALLLFFRQSLFGNTLGTFGSCFWEHFASLGNLRSLVIFDSLCAEVHSVMSFLICCYVSSLFLWVDEFQDVLLLCRCYQNMQSAHNACR